MIQDALARFATAQTGTLNVAHTDLIDTLAAGNDYNGTWFVVQVSTSFTSGGTLTPVVRFELQSSSSLTFDTTTDVTLVASNTYTAAKLTAGKMWAVKVPPGAKRYIRAYNKVTGVGDANSGYFTAGAWNSFLTTDIDVRIDNRYLLV